MLRKSNASKLKAQRGEEDAMSVWDSEVDSMEDNWMGIPASPTSKEMGAFTGAGTTGAGAGYEADRGLLGVEAESPNET